MRKYDLAIFDFDGTLADTLAWFESVFNETADRFRFKRVSASDRETLRASGPREILSHLELPLWKVPLVAHHLRSRMSRELQGIALFDGVPALLSELHAAGVTISIVSSNSEQNVRALLGPRSARQVRFYGCGTGMFGKAAKVRKVVARAGIMTTRALLIGDEVRDIEAARAAQVASGAVAWGYNTPQTLRALQPTEFFERISDIARAFAHTQ